MPRKIRGAGLLPGECPGSKPACTFIDVAWFGGPRPRLQPGGKGEPRTERNPMSQPVPDNVRPMRPVEELPARDEREAPRRPRASLQARDQAQSMDAVG